MTCRILDGSFGVPVEELNGAVASGFMVSIDCCGEQDVKRSLGAIFTSVFVVKRRALPFDRGSKETAGIQYNNTANIALKVSHMLYKNLPSNLTL